MPETKLSTAGGRLAVTRRRRAPMAAAARQQAVGAAQEGVLFVKQRAERRSGAPPEAVRATGSRRSRPSPPGAGAASGCKRLRKPRPRFRQRHRRAAAGHAGTARRRCGRSRPAARSGSGGPPRRSCHHTRVDPGAEQRLGNGEGREHVAAGAAGRQHDQGSRARRPRPPEDGAVRCRARGGASGPGSCPIVSPLATSDDPP